MKNKNKTEDDFDYRPHRAGADTGNKSHYQGDNFARTNGWFYSPWRRLDRLEQWFASHPRLEKILLAIMGLTMIAMAIHHWLEFPAVAY